LGGPVGAGLGGLFGALFSKLDITTDYTLDLHFVLICGRSEDLAATPASFVNTLEWDTETPISLAREGVRRIELSGKDDPRWKSSLPGITQISLEVTS